MSKKLQYKTKPYQGKGLLIAIIASIPEKKMRSVGSGLIQKIGNDKNSKTIIEHQTQLFKKFLPMAKICIATAFDSKKVIKAIPRGVKYIEHEFNNSVNQGYSLCRVLESFDCQNLLIINGNHIFDKQTIASLTYKNSFILANKNQKEHDLGCVLNTNGIIQHVFFDLENKLYEFIFLSKQDTIKLKNIITTINYKNMFLFEIINELINNECHIEYKILLKDNIVVYNNISKIKSIKRILYAKN
jgi:hypothetical protein